MIKLVGSIGTRRTNFTKLGVCGLSFLNLRQEKSPSSSPKIPAGSRTDQSCKRILVFYLKEESPASLTWVGHPKHHCMVRKGHSPSLPRYVALCTKNWSRQNEAGLLGHGYFFSLSLATAVFSLSLATAILPS